MSRLLLTSSLLLAAPALAVPQETGQQPPGLEWRSIETDHFQIVFPEEAALEGQRTANTLEYLWAPLGRTLPRKGRRISVFLMNQTTKANGYVNSAPRYSGFFTTPPQSPFGGLTDWLTDLSVHEGRHTVQFDALNRGFTRVGGWLFGDLGRAAFSTIATPAWFWEGDAVLAETTLTRGGRGRQPAFDLALRAPLLSERKYSYYKHYFGSYKDRTANPYSLGYPLVARARREGDALTWSRVTADASRWSFWPWTFNRALGNAYGKGPAGLYQDTMAELGSAWRAQLDGLTLTPFRILNATPPRTYETYVFPTYDRDGSVIAQKLSYDEPFALVRIDKDGRESRLASFAPSELLATRTTPGSGRLVWSETVPDLRWGGRTYSVVVVHNLATGETRRLTQGSKLLNPVISPDGKRIAAVEFTTTSHAAVVLLDAESGREIARLPNPDDNLPVAPSWSPDGTTLVFTRQGRDGRALSTADVATGELRDVLPRGWEDVTYPVLHGRHVFYNSPYSGIDNIYALDLDSGRRFQVTSSKFGAYYPHVSPDGQRLLYSDYTVRGNAIAEAVLDPATWTPIEDIQDRNLAYFEPEVDQEGGRPLVDADSIPTREYPVRGYRPLTHALNVHSWILLPAVPEGRAGFLSRDPLDTLSLLGSLLYDTNEDVVGVDVLGTYKALYPLIDVGFRYGGRAAYHEEVLADGTTQTTDIRYSWRESGVRGGLRLPFNLSRGIHQTAAEVGVQSGYTHIADREYVEDFAVGNGSLVTLEYHGALSHTRQPALRDVVPTFSQTLAASYTSTPSGADFYGSILTLKGKLHFPGLFPHHALMLRGGYEEQKPETYRFKSALAPSRGYDSFYHDQTVSTRTDYVFPILDPDLAAGSILYIKRVKGGLFYDFGRGHELGAGRTELYRSAGAELRFESFPFSLPFPIDLGVRYVHCFDEERSIGGSRNRVEALVSLGF